MSRYSETLTAGPWTSERARPWFGKAAWHCSCGHRADSEVDAHAHMAEHLVTDRTRAADAARIEELERRVAGAEFAQDNREEERRIAEADDLRTTFEAALAEARAEGFQAGQKSAWDGEAGVEQGLILAFERVESLEGDMSEGVMMALSEIADALDELRGRWG